MIYREDFYKFTDQKVPLTYILSIETNLYFRNMGLNSKLLEIMINFINPDQHILVTKESSMGKKSNISKRVEQTLIKNGFTKTFWVDDTSLINKINEFHDTVCAKQKTL